MAYLVRSIEEQQLVFFMPLQSWLGLPFKVSRNHVSCIWQNMPLVCQLLFELDKNWDQVMDHFLRYVKGLHYFHAYFQEVYFQEVYFHSKFWPSYLRSR